MSIGILMEERAAESKKTTVLPAVLGLHIGHDASASLVVDGEIVAAIGEERLSRTKQHYGFPFEAIGKVLEIAGIEPRDVDIIALGGGDPLSLNPWQARHIFNADEKGRVDFSNAVPTSIGREACFGALRIAVNKALGLRDHRPEVARRGLEHSLRQCGLDPAAVEVFDHHLCHAISAYSTSPFEEALAITIDGYGDGINTGIWSCSPTEIRRVAHGPGADDAGAYSPGDFYSYVTCYLGFKRNRHEGKITGLASYADPHDLYDRIEDLLQVDVESACFSSSTSAFRYTRERRPHVIFRRLARWALSGRLWDPILVAELQRRCRDASAAQVAAAAQLLLEERVVDLVSYWVEHTGLRKVTLAGGVFANVKLNQRIAEIEGVEDVYVHPGMGDGGLSLGAALWGSRQPVADQVKVLHPQLDDVFLGPEYSITEIRAALEQAGVDYTEEESIERKVAQAIHEGKVVARFDGRMEYGPRALGNRSIMAAPVDKKINDWLNKRLHRTEFMPFAPAVLEEHMSEIFPAVNVGQTLKFMTITLNVDPDWQERAPAVCHVDGTARPQVLDPVNTPSFYKVVSFYHQLSGLPLVINTSFNMHEEPIVCTPEDAVRAFQLGHLDALAIGPFWTEQTAKDLTDA